MIVRRVPPYPIDIQYDVPMPHADYLFTIENAPKTVEAQVTLTSDANSKVTYTLTGDFIKYDHDYAVNIYEVNNDAEEHVVVQDILNVIRPYVDVRQLVSTASDITLYEEHELLARTIINSIVGPQGFLFEKNLLEVVGQGTDYLPLWNLAYKVLQVYENSVLVYDANQSPPYLGDYRYGITQDRTAIYKDFIGNANYVNGNNGSYNRAEKKPLKYPYAVSDSFNQFTSLDTPGLYEPYVGTMFPEGTDYLIIYETGHRVIPNDIRDATIRLMDDIRCGKLEYYKRSIDQYQTDQFTITWDQRHLDGTGNLFVDKALEKYTTSIRKPWVI
jgi:hypothetical protein